MASTKTIELTNDEVTYLQALIRQRTIHAQVVDRAKVLLYKAQGATYSDIAERLDVNINTVNFAFQYSKKVVCSVPCLMTSVKDVLLRSRMMQFYGLSVLHVNALPTLAMPRNFAP